MGERPLRFLIRLGLMTFLLAGCGIPGGVPTPEASEPGPAGSQSPEILFHNGTILTMEAGQPNAEAILVSGDKILAVGSESEVMARAGPQAIQIDLQGKVLTPGFIDSHQHRIGDGPAALGYRDSTPLIQAALQQGLTTIDELYVDQARLNQLRELDESGQLRLRVNAYLPVNENSAEGRIFDPYYQAYQPEQMVSPHVRVAGLKVFTDFNNATILLWKQGDLNAFLLKEHQKGWQLAVKTVSTRSMEMILKAFEYVQQSDPGVVDSRNRLEHALFIAPGQIQRIKQLRLIPVINFNNPGQLVGLADMDAMIAREPKDSYTPWRSLVQAGIPIASCSGFPSFYVDEPTGAPFGSPIHLIYQAVTRDGNLGTKPEPWMLDQAITASQAMRALTIGGAYASFEEKVKGSLMPGKLADLVILSEDPVSIPAEQINNIQVLMTMVGGKVEWCAPGSEALCPLVPSATVSATAQASYPYATASQSLPDHPPSYALDDSLDTWWTAGTGPEQWIQIDLGGPTTVRAIRLVGSQYPEGNTIHQIWAGADPNNLTLVHEFNGFTKDLGTLEFAPPAPLTNIRYIRVLTTQSPSWVAWREIEIR